MINKSMVSIYANQDDSAIHFGGWDSRAVKGGRLHVFKADSQGAVKTGKMTLTSGGGSRLLSRVERRQLHKKKHKKSGSSYSYTGTGSHKNKGLFNVQKTEFDTSTVFMTLGKKNFDRFAD